MTKNLHSAKGTFCADNEQLYNKRTMKMPSSVNPSKLDMYALSKIFATVAVKWNNSEV